MLIYTDLVEEIIADMAERVPGFSHLNADGIAVAASTRWAGSTSGNLATCIGLAPARGEAGPAEPEPSFSIWVRSRSRTVVEVSEWFRRRPVEIDFGGGPCRYLILLRLPRLLENDPLETLVHELFHVGERFDGELRPLRHGRLFDYSVKRLMRTWLDRAEGGLAELARMNLAQLRERFGSVIARRMPSRFQSEVILPAGAPCSYKEGMTRLYPGYRLAAGYAIRPTQFTAPEVPRRVTQRDCVLRNYHSGGAADLPPAFARYAAEAARSVAE